MRSIIHLDADAFFASVEQASDPRLRGKPIAVGGEKRGIIASASYEARKFGIYTPMPSAQARRLCPRLILLPGDFEKYELFSRLMFSYAYDFTPDVEIGSIDEGYFDLTGVRKPAVGIADTIRRAIRQSLKLSVSEGIGSNKLVSQIASKLHKPAAFENVPNGQEKQFLHLLPNRWLPGIGPKTAVRLNTAGLVEIGQIAATPIDLLSLLLGRQAPLVRQFANGIDERPLVPAGEPQKSFSHQETFAEDVTDEDYVEAVLRRMADRLFAAVREEGRSVRTLTVKVRYNDRDENQRAASLREPTDLETDVYGRLHELLNEAWERRVSLRMVSLKLSNAYEGVFRSELPLEADAKNHAARERLAAALDELRRNRGWSVVLRAHDFQLRQTALNPNPEIRNPKESRNPKPERTTLHCQHAPRTTQHAATSVTRHPSPITPSAFGLCAPDPPEPPGASPLSPPRGEGAGERGPVLSRFMGRGISPVKTNAKEFPPPSGQFSIFNFQFSIFNSRTTHHAAPPSIHYPSPVTAPATPTDRSTFSLSPGERAGVRGISPVKTNAKELPPPSGQFSIFNFQFSIFNSPTAPAPPSSIQYPVSSIPHHAYIPLRVRSYYTFLDSTLSPAALVTHAQQHGLPAVALTDLGNLHGAVQFAQAAQRAGIKPIFGTELQVNDHPLLLYVESARGYHNLNRLLSRKAELGAEREEGAVATQQRRPISTKTLEPFTEGLIAVGPDPSLAPLFPGRFYHLATKQLRATPFPVVACPAIHYGASAERLKYNIVQSIRTLTLLREKHPEKRLDGCFHFRAPLEMAVACRDHPEWLAHSLEIADRCHFEIPFGKPQFPAFDPANGSIPREFLHQLVYDGLRRRYGERAPSMRPQVEQELSIISAVGYEEYFLVVWSILQDCRAHDIEWITRGSAADSLVCYCLGISDVCPVRFGLYFRRFLNQERMALNKLPDIDVDFPHDRKDDVVDLIFAKYKRAHCAVVGGFSTFQARSAFADVAKVLGVAEREVRRFTEHFPWSFGGGWVPDQPAPSGGARLRELLAASPENRDLPLTEEPFTTAIDMAEFLDGFPRNPKMHPCGVVLSRQPMHELTPTFISNKGYPTTHFDMDAVEAIGLVKIDVLAQGGLAVMRDVQAMLAVENPKPETRNPKEARNSKSEIHSEPPKLREPAPSPLQGERAGERGPLLFGLMGRGTSSANHNPRDQPSPSAQFAISNLQFPIFNPPSTRSTPPPVTSDFALRPSFGLRPSDFDLPPPSILSPPPSLPGFPSTAGPFDDPQIWDLISSGQARAVHHIESPAMTGLCRQCNVRDIDTLIAIVSVIRPGAANEGKKLAFTRRYQGLEPVTYPHPSLEPALRDTFGLVVYEEHILQICEAFAGLHPGRADVLRRALNKQKRAVIEEIREEFFASAKARGHTDEKIAEVWGLVSGFAGYAFCKAHSTAYGVEAYQAAWLKLHYPAEFMAAVLTNGKGFYDPLVYVLESYRLGLRFLPPTINDPGPAFTVCSSRREEAGVRAECRMRSVESDTLRNHRSEFQTATIVTTTPVAPTDCRTLSLSLGERVPRSMDTHCALEPPKPLAASPSPLQGERAGVRGPTLSGFMGRAGARGISTTNVRPNQLPAPSGQFSIFNFQFSIFNSPTAPASIRVPLTRAKGLSQRTADALLAARSHGPFSSLADFFHRVHPLPEEMEILIRAGAFDEFGQSRTQQFWEAQYLHRTFAGGQEPGQHWLLSPPSLDRFPNVPLREPTRRDRLQAETELFGYAVSGHPLELFDDVAWDTYCPVARLGQHLGQTVVTCGLVVEQRVHHQITGEPMKFLTLADWTGMIETELFAKTYKTYGLATVRYPVLEITATVEPFDNGRGFSLRVLHAGRPRTNQPDSTCARRKVPLKYHS